MSLWHLLDCAKDSGKAVTCVRLTFNLLHICILVFVLRRGTVSVGDGLDVI